MSRSARNRVVALVLACVLAGGLAAPLTVARAEDLRATSALGLLPEDTAFYVAMLRGGDQWKRFAESNWVKQYLALPELQKLATQAKQQAEQADNPQAEMVKLLWSLPENQELIKLLGDAASQEMFLAGGPGWAGFMELSRKLNAAQRAGTLEMLKPFDENENFEDRAAAPQRIVLDALVDNLKLVAVPDLLIGFRLTDSAPAERQFARLEALIRAQLAGHPQWNERIEKEKIAGGPFLVARFSGKEIPWADFRQATPQLEGPQLDKFQQHVEGQSLVFACGVCRGYVLLFLGSSTESIARLGQGKLLIDRPECAPLRQHADKPFTGVSYFSTPFMQSLNQLEDTFDYLRSMARTMLQAAEVPPEIDEELQADLKGLVDRVQAFVEYPQAITSFAFQSPRGYEGYSYQFGMGRLLDGSRPLSILEHAGGEPIFVAAGRSKQMGPALVMARDFYARYFYYLDKILALKVPEQDKEKYLRGREALLPVLKRLDEAFTKSFVPGIQEGQTAVVLDATLTAKQWHPAQPPATQPLPLPELAWVQGVTDARLVRHGMEEFYACLRAGHQALIDADPTAPAEVQAWKLPAPKLVEGPQGILASHPFPEDWQFGNGELAWTGALNPRVAVLTLSPATAQRLLAARPLKVDSPLYRPDQPLAGFSHFNFARLLDATLPWVEYGIDQAPEGAGLNVLPNVDDGAPFEDLKRQDDIQAEPDLSPPGRDLPAEAPPNLPLPQQQSQGAPRRVLLPGERWVLADPDEQPARPALPAAPPLTREEIKAHVRTLFRFLRAYRGSTSITYLEENAVVTRTEWHYEDLPAVK